MMMSNLNKEFEQFLKQRSSLRNTLENTNNALNEISGVDIFPIDEIRNKVLTKNILKKLDHYLGCHPTFIILGPNYISKSKVANKLLGEEFFQQKNVENLKWVHVFNGENVKISVLFNWETHNTTLFREKATPWKASPVDENDDKLGVKRTIEEKDRIGFEVSHPKLENNFHIIITCEKMTFLNKIIFSQTLPIVLYVLEESVSAETIEELHELRELYKGLPVFFIYAPEADSTHSHDNKIEYLADCLPEDTDDPVDIMNRKKSSVIHHLALLGYINVDDNSDTAELGSNKSAKSKLVYGIDQVRILPHFVQSCLKTYLIHSAQILNDIHCYCLRQFILSAFDMAREIQITPKRILYAKEKEAELFKNLTDFATKKQEELYDLIQSILKLKREELIMKAAKYKYRGLKYETVTSYQDLRNASSEIHFLIFSELNTEISSQIVQLVDCLHDTFIGTLQRCLESLEKDEFEQEDNMRASDAVNQILNVAYHIEISESNPSSVLHSFLEKLRRLVHSINLPWRLPKKVDEAWRKNIAEQMIQSLSPARVVKNIFSTQFRDRLKASHSAFNIAIRALQDQYVDLLERTEEQRIAIRKFHAPKMARLALESMSLCDMIRYGMPHLSKEIGRGQYGVVYSCDSWGGAGPCAVKSVVPPDDKHWNDLSLEFYYTRTVPEHKRIVRLRGSVVDNTYGGGCSTAVLLIMDRLSRDLYIGLRSGLSWVIRLQIAIDVVEGIRYLHSLGLVHRDIKLKNVLLDEENRAKLTDLGFCIPGAMMSGSIVGTPLHMAPELLSGHYDNSVDVYAFGILFWYICAGNVRLPLVFENFQNKEQLWSNVRKGIRPERLQHFDDQCWKLMQECWAGEPSKRPLLGYVQPLLESILDKYVNASTRGSLSE